MDSKDTVEKKKGKLNKQQRHYLISVIIMVAVTLLAAYYVLQGDTKTILVTLSEAKSLYVFLMLLSAVSCFVLEGAVLAILTKMYKRSFKVYQGILNGFIGGFFSAITPFSSGGQFAQAYTFSRQGVRPADSASILVMLFIVSQAVIIIYGAFAMIFGYEATISNMKNIQILGLDFSPMALSIVGFCINIFALLFLFVMAYSKWIHRFILTRVIGLGGKLHLIKDPERKKTSLAAQVATFRIELGRLMKNWWIMLLTGVLEFVKFTIYNMMPFLAGMALSAPMEGKFIESIWASSYLSMITSFIPIPGASGGVEYGFYLLFSKIYGDAAITSAANILYRSISFYFTLLIGFVIFVLYRGSPKKDIYQFDNRKTFVDLQIISVAQTQANSADPYVSTLREVKVVPEQEALNATNTNSISIMDTQSSPVKTKRSLWPWKRKNRSNKVPDYQTFLSPMEVEKSFEDIKETLIMEQKDIYKENDEISASSQKDLKKVYDDVSKIEKDDHLSDKTDTEIALAIKADLDALKEEQKRHDKRKMARKLKKAEKKAKKEEEPADKK